MIRVGVRNEYHHLMVKPLNSLIFLTYRCTSHCKTCNIWSWGGEKSRELNKDEWLSVLSELKRANIRSLEIFGGDALLRKDVIFDIIKFCNQNGIHTHFPTNANLCDRETAKNLIEAGLYTVYLSLDDLGEAHDDMRGTHGTFSRVTEALDAFLSLRDSADNPRVIICTTVSNMNFKDLPRIVEFLENYQIDGIYPRITGEFNRQNVESSAIDGVLPQPYFVPTDMPTHLLRKEELGEFKEILKYLRGRKSKVYIDFRPFDLADDRTFLEGIHHVKNCRLATTLVTVDPQGNVAPCPFFLSYNIGNLKESGIKDIWGNLKHRRLIRYQQKKKLAICQNCNLSVYYPSMAETFSWRLKKALGHYG